MMNPAEILSATIHHGQEKIKRPFLEKAMHIIYLAVDPSMQHHGIAAELLEEAIDYAQKHKLMISLETHNPKNVEFYEKFGFKVYGVMEKNFPLKQYCLIREVQ